MTRWLCSKTGKQSDQKGIVTCRQRTLRQLLQLQRLLHLGQAQSASRDTCSRHGLIIFEERSSGFVRLWADLLHDLSVAVGEAARAEVQRALRALGLDLHRLLPALQQGRASDQSRLSTALACVRACVRVHGRPDGSWCLSRCRRCGQPGCECRAACSSWAWQAFLLPLDQWAPHRAWRHSSRSLLSAAGLADTVSCFTGVCSFVSQLQPAADSCKPFGRCVLLRIAC